MKILLIIEGLGLLYCLYSWIRDHPKSKMEWVISTGKRISHCFCRRRYRNMNSECCEMVFPEAPDEERKRQYMSLRVGGLVLWMLLGNAVFMAALYFDTPEEFPGLNLERPAYGEDDRNVRYQLSIQGENEVLTEEIDIEVPEQQPAEAEITQQFKEAEQLVRTAFEKFSGIEQSIDLPDRYKEIIIQYETEDPAVLKEDGEILWGNVQQETNVRMNVVLLYGEQSRNVEMELLLQPKERSLQDTLSEVKESLTSGDYLTDQTLQLPTEDDNGLKYHWSLAKDNNHIWLGILWILILPVMISVMREQERKRKVKVRKEKIRQRYPDMLNKLMILMGAGMSITKAWLKITEDYMIQKEKYHQEEPLYEEMYHAGLRLNNGYSMNEVIRVFAQRNSVREIQQLCSILQTGWKRGDSHVLLHLKELHDRSWEIRKRTARKLSEEADTKLLLPLMLMLMVVLIIVLAPAMMTMKI